MLCNCALPIFAYVLSDMEHVAGLMLGIFLRCVQVLCKLLAKGFANKTIHDIMHAGSW